VAERRELYDLSQGGNAGRLDAPREAAEQHRPRIELNVRPVRLEQITNHVASWKITPMV
jgi:hypothetical protein